MSVCVKCGKSSVTKINNISYFTKNKTLLNYLGYIKATSICYVLTWLLLVILVDWLHMWVGYASIITAIVAFNLNYVLLRIMWTPGSYVGFLKANLIAYVVSWIMLVALVDWYHLWVGYASIIITAILFNLKFLLLKIIWKTNEVKNEN